MKEEFITKNGKKYKLVEVKTVKNYSNLGILLLPFFGIIATALIVSSVLNTNLPLIIMLFLACFIFGFYFAYYGTKYLMDSLEKW